MASPRINAPSANKMTEQQATEAIEQVNNSQRPYATKEEAIASIPNVRKALNVFAKDDYMGGLETDSLSDAVRRLIGTDSKGWSPAELQRVRSLGEELEDRLFAEGTNVEFEEMPGYSDMQRLTDALLDYGE